MSNDRPEHVRVGADSNALDVYEDRDYQLTLRRHHDCAQFHLWYVTHDTYGGRYCLAESVKGAIGQVCPFDCSDARRLVFERDAVAYRVPLHIRGWGKHTF